MATQEIFGELKGEFQILGHVGPLFEIYQQGERFYTFRNVAPLFAIEGDSAEEVVAAAFTKISSFLSRIHTFGFRTAA